MRSLLQVLDGPSLVPANGAQFFYSVHIFSANFLHMPMQPELLKTPPRKHSLKERWRMQTRVKGFY